MKFDKPAGENPIDQLKVVGRPHDRIDGPLKTTGTARYAYEWHEEAPNAAYGYIVGSAIAKGRLTALDTDAAQKAPGVLAVITASNAGALGKGDKNTARLLGGPTIEHYHQAIALVVAETFEQARAAASLVQAHYRRNKGAYSLADEKQAVNQPPEDTPDKNVGDFDGAFTSAAVKIDATYTRLARHQVVILFTLLTVGGFQARSVGEDPQRRISCICQGAVGVLKVVVRLTRGDDQNGADAGGSSGHSAAVGIIALRITEGLIKPDNAVVALFFICGSLIEEADHFAGLGG